MTKHLFFSSDDEKSIIHFKLRYVCCVLAVTSPVPMLAVGLVPILAVGLVPMLAVGLVPMLAVGLIPMLAVGLTPKPMYYCFRQIVQRYRACTSLQLCATCVESMDNRSCTAVLVQGRVW